MSRVARAGAALAVALAAGRAGAFLQSTDPDTGAPLSWRVPLVPYHVNPTHPFTSPSCATTAAGDPVIAAARAGFEAWRQGCASFTALYAGPLDAIRVATLDSPENVVVMRQGWCSGNAQAIASGCMADPNVDCGNLFDCFEDSGTSADHRIVALTSVLHDTRTGRIVSADIEVIGWDGQGTGASLTGAPHGWYFTCDKPAGAPQCATYGLGSCFYLDLQNTLTHEAGHFLGLAHPCGDPGLPQCAADPTLQPAMAPTTSAGELTKRVLSADDVAGVCAIYPEGSGGCACGSAGGGGAVAALIAALAIRPRRRR